MNTASILSLCISTVMMLIGIATFVVSLIAKGRKDGSTLGEISITLTRLADDVKEVKRDVKDMLKDMTSLEKRVVNLETRLEICERAIDELRSMISG